MAHRAGRGASVLPGPFREHRRRHHRWGRVAPRYPAQDMPFVGSPRCSEMSGAEWTAELAGARSKRRQWQSASRRGWKQRCCPRPIRGSA